jgi:adenylate cyclase
LAIRFEDHVLDPVRRELSRNGASVRVEPKVFDLLIYLIENRHRVVSKGDLIAQVWGGRIVSDSALTHAVNAARGAIGDDGKAQRLIRTSSRWGYRFVGSVTPQAGTEPAPGSADAPASRNRPALALPDKPSIAVLPFRNTGDDSGQEYFADGLVEDIITALSRFKSLFVIARNSSFTYKGRAIDIRQVGRELGVRYVLEGSIRKGGNRVRITAQLIDAISGANVWAERYDRDLKDVFAVQDEITASVAGLIEPALAEAERQRVLRKPPDRLDAWEAYQRGLWHFYKYGSEENLTALTFFRQAIALDPNFAPGHYGCALALQWDIWHYSHRPFGEVQGTPREEALVAVSLDDKDAMAHAVLAHMLMWGSEWEAAIAEARAALALNPNNAFVISMLGCVLGFGGYRDEALDRLHQAMRASPHDPLTWLWMLWMAFIRLSARKFDASLEILHQLVRLRPGLAPAHELMAACLAHLGRLDDASAALERIPVQFSKQLRRHEQRPPWIRPEDYAIRQEGLRLASDRMTERRAAKTTSRNATATATSSRVASSNTRGA